MNHTLFSKNSFNEIYIEAIVKRNFEIIKHAVEDKFSPLFQQKNDRWLETLLILMTAQGKKEYVVYLLTQSHVIEYMKNLTNLSELLKTLLCTALTQNQYPVAEYLLKEKILEPFENMRAQNPFVLLTCLKQTYQCIKQYGDLKITEWLKAKLDYQNHFTNSSANCIRILQN